MVDADRPVHASVLIPHSLRSGQSSRSVAIPSRTRASFLPNQSRGCIRVAIPSSARTAREKASRQFGESVGGSEKSVWRGETPDWSDCCRWGSACPVRGVGWSPAYEDPIA